MKSLFTQPLSAIALLGLVACAHQSVTSEHSTETLSVVRLVDRPFTSVSLDVPNAPRDAISERWVVTVPVNRTNPGGQTIDLEFFRFKRLSHASPDVPPIFVLRGGPGYPGLGNAVESASFYANSIQRYTQLSDLVIVGQRGFGTSGDMSCDSVPRSPLEQTNTYAKSQDRYLRTAQLCRDKYLGQGRDLSGYNIVEMADDVAEIAHTLGYNQIQLKGNSFGSFWAMAIMRRHGGLVARATLSALEGPDHTIDRPSAVKAVFSAIANDAAKSERYSKRIPEEGLISAYQAVIDRATQRPITTSFVDEGSGETIDFSIDAAGLRQLVYGVTRRPVWRYVMSDWPDDLLKIIEGDYRDAAIRLYRFRTGTDADSAAEEIIECSSGVSARRREKILNDPALSLIGTPTLFNEDICAVWGAAVIEMDRSESPIDVPTVLIQGTWDISTPYADANTVRRMFTNHHFVKVEGGSHGAIHEAEEEISGFSTVLDQWYVSGRDTDIPNLITLAPLSWSGED